MLDLLIIVKRVKIYLRIIIDIGFHMIKLATFYLQLFRINWKETVKKN